MIHYRTLQYLNTKTINRADTRHDKNVRINSLLFKLLIPGITTTAKANRKPATSEHRNAARIKAT